MRNLITKFLGIAITLTLLGSSELTSGQRRHRVGMIADVLGPGVPAEVGGLPVGDDLQRQDLDLTRFRDALSNDGTGALFYFRPYAGEVNRNRWVIQLKGGGGCGTPSDCAERWLSEQTFFGMTQMSAQLAPSPGTRGDGILYRGTDFENPFDGWNHVIIWYSSSDLWSGTARDQIVETTHPITGVPVRFRMHFLGNRILDATIDTLRQDGVPAPVHTLSGTPLVMPDLDAAEEVVLAGASAGGFGVTNNLDRLAARLARRSEYCPAGQCGPVVWGLADSSFGPSYKRLDFTGSPSCGPIPPALCTYQGFVRNDIRNGSVPLWRPLGDQSCVRWHHVNDRATTWQCFDLTHVVRHHVTTPLFIRMGQNDSLISGVYLDLGVGIPDFGPLTLPGFAALVRAQLSDLSDLPTTAHEGAAMQQAPGAFGPSCVDHETLSSNASVYQTRVFSGGNIYTMFDVVRNWRLGTGPTNIVAMPGDPEFCPGE